MKKLASTLKQKAAQSKWAARSEEDKKAAIERRKAQKKQG